MARQKLIDNQLTTFKIESRHPQWVVWPIVVAFLGIVMLGVDLYLHEYTIREVIPAYTEVDEFGIVHQSTDFTCVPAAFTTLLRHQGIVVEQREVADRLGTTVFGTDAWRIPGVGRSYGYTITRRKLGFDELVAAETPFLLYNRFTEGLHVNYIPPGRLDPSVVSSLFGGSDEPLLPVMDPVDGLVLMDRIGFEEYFDGAEPKSVFEFTKAGEAPVPIDLLKVLQSGNSPLIKVGHTLPELP